MYSIASYVTQHRYRTFITLTTILVPVIALTIMVIFMIDPLAVDRLSYEDSTVENLSATALFIACLIALFASLKLFRKRFILLACTALIMAGGLFVIGMEEISWMQRALDVQPSTYFIENNWQQETNLHNLNTDLSETVYYFGAFLLLVLIPFFTASTTQLLDRLRLHKLAVFLPSAWLIVPFSVMVGFTKSIDQGLNPTLLITLIATITILIVTIRTATKNHKSVILFSALIALVAVCLGQVMFTFYNYDLNGIRDWFGSEYKELFIAFGLLIYTVDIYIRPIGLRGTSMAAGK